MFIDTHAHLYLSQFKEDIDAVIQRAEHNNVKKVFLPNIDSSTISDMLQLASDFPDICFPMIGLHPCSVKKDYKEELSIVKEMLEKERFYGIGETGIDLYWDKTYVEEQKDAFSIQIELAKKYRLPVIIHSRDSLDQTIALVDQNNDDSLTGIFHCFNGTIDQYEHIKSLGFYVGLGGVITFKNANLDDLIEHVDLVNCVLETDAPYLSPVPFRGKRNESAYIPYVAEKIAQVKGISIDAVREITTDAAKKVYLLES